MNKNKEASKAAVQRAIDIVGSQLMLSKMLTASGTKVSQPGVQRWATGSAKPRLEMAIAIEQLTKGKVKAIDIRPDLSAVLNPQAS